MFALPLVGLKGSAVRPPLWLQLSALSGLLMTMLYVGLSIVPIIEVESRASFAIKIGGLIVITNILGLAVFGIFGRKRPIVKSEPATYTGD